MVTALALATVLSCAKPSWHPHPRPPPPPPVTVRCEGTDLVTRNHDFLEVRRVLQAPACVVTRCEGELHVSRVRATGEVLWATPDAVRCGVVVRPPPPPPPPLRFGLSSRG